MSLLSSFIAHIQKEHLFQKKDALILAVSGGVDSAVLCELCYRAGYTFTMVHCNFRLRGEESERDEVFVKSLGEKYDVKVLVKKFDTESYAVEHKLSIQVAARELRYAWFEELLKEAGAGIPLPPASCLLTAHHGNDNIETLLMNFFKGTGIRGLQGIPLKQGKIVRPLLFAKKEEILSYARETGLDFVEDSSNISEKYTRNYFRNQLFPSLQKVFPQVEDNLLDNLERFRDIQLLYQEGIDLHRKKLLEYKGEEIHIPVLKLLKIGPLKTVVYEIIKDYGFTAHQTEELLHLLKSESGRYIASATHKIIRNRKWIIIAPVKIAEISLVVVDEKDTSIEFPGGKLTFERGHAESFRLTKDPSTAWLDAGRITYPLLVRKWETGDYFYPLGMPKKKKLSRFFIDQKMSLTEKEKTWVIESDKRILWIIAKRIDDRFKITDRTTQLLKIHFKEP